MDTKFELVEEPESQEEPVDNQEEEAQVVSSGESQKPTPEEGAVKPEVKEVKPEDRSEVKSEVVTEVKTEDRVEEGKTAGDTFGKELYTPEEMRSLDPTQIDTSRIPPEMQAFYKSMQSGWTKKFQEVADLRKQITQERVPQPKDIYEAFDRDPHSVLDTLRGEIVKKKSENPYDENIPKLENLRDVLIERRLFNQERVMTAKTIATEAREIVRKEIPNYQEKVEKLNDFATSLGFSMEELAKLTDPIKMGPSAVKLTLAINRMYDLANKGQVFKNKAVKPQPTSVESAGTGEHTSKPSYKEVLRKARESGDWTEYLELKGAI